jgi:hypothetical protein
MKTTRPLMYTVSLAAILALSACGKTDESASQVPATPPPAATAAAPAMAPSSSTQSPAPSGSAMAPMNSGSSAQPPASSGTAAGSGH